MIKLLGILLLTITITVLSYAQTPNEILLQNLEFEKQTRQKQKKTLSAVKYFLISGNTQMARITLEDQLLSTLPKSLEAVRLRYWSELYFIEGEYQKSYNTLNDPLLNSDQYYNKTCKRKLILRLILNKTDSLESFLDQCRYYTQNQGQDWWWIERVAETTKGREHKDQVINELKQTTLEKKPLEEVKRYLKLILFLSQEELIAEKINQLNQELRNDPEVRELLSLSYFRLGQFKKAMNLIEDLDYTNTENIRGSIYIMQKRYELAYPQLKLVWRNKFSTDEAITRSLPLAWKIKEWEDGLEILKKIPLHIATEQERALVGALFYSALEEYPQAIKSLEQIPYYSPLAKKFKVDQLRSYVLFQQGDMPKASAFYSERSCKRGDLYACWVFPMLSEWENFFLSMKREEDVTKNPEQYIQNILTMSSTQGIVEDTLIDTSYIEELDRADQLLDD